MTRLNAQDISRLTAEPETFHVEFKEAKNALPNSFWESYSAFANTDGGIVILGVREVDAKFQIQGVRNPEKLTQEIWNNINNRQKISANILFNRHIYTVDCDGKHLLVVDVPRAMRVDRPVYVGANPYTGSYRRNGEGDYHCDEEAVEAMIRDKCRETADHRVVDTMTIADLNQDTLRRYRNLFRQCRPDDLTANADDEEFLCRHGAAKRDEAGVVRPLLASVLMFGDFHSIQEQCPHYFVDYREKLDDNPRYSDRICPFTVGFSGNLFDFYFRVVSRLVADVKTPFKLDERLLRVDDTPVHKALRECLANTLIHADHTGRRGIVIEKTFRHITFANPGALRLPKDIAIAGGTSDARNDVLFTLFALVEIGEKLGTGLCQLFALWKEHGWPEPELQEQFDPERTLLVLDYNDAEDATQASNAPDNGINTPQKTGIENNDICDKNGGICDENNDICDENSNNCDANGHLIPIARQEEMLLSLISQNPKITQKALSEASGLSARTVFSRLNNLQKSNRIRRVGPDKGGHWEVLNS